MKATGIVRRIDELGRVVIPKEIRRTQRIRQGDPLEIFTTGDGEVIFKKYSPVGELQGVAVQYAEVLSRSFAGGEDLEGVAAADTLGAADLLRDDHPAQLIDAADDSGCFHLCTILPILHFPMLCSYYVEAEGKYTPARPVFAKQGRL